MEFGPHPAGLGSLLLPLLGCGLLVGCGLARDGGFLAGDGHAEVDVVLLPGASLGLGVTSVGSLVSVVALVVTTIRVIVWRHVAGVVGAQPGFTAAREREALLKGLY